MFSKKPVAYDFEHNLEPEFLQFLERMEDLENNTKRTDRELDMMSMKWDTEISGFKREARMSGIELENIKKNLSELKQTFMDVVAEFKAVAMAEDFEKLKMFINNWDVDKHMSASEFERLVKERIG